MPIPTASRFALPALPADASRPIEEDKKGGGGGRASGGMPEGLRCWFCGCRCGGTAEVEEEREGPDGRAAEAGGAREVESDRLGPDVLRGDGGRLPLTE